MFIDNTQTPNQLYRSSNYLLPLNFLQYMFFFLNIFFYNWLGPFVNIILLKWLGNNFCVSAANTIFRDIVVMIALFTLFVRLKHSMLPKVLPIICSMVDVLLLVSDL